MQWTGYESNSQPLGYESDTLPLHTAATAAFAERRLNTCSDITYHVTLPSHTGSLSMSLCSSVSLSVPHELVSCNSRKLHVSHRKFEFDGTFRTARKNGDVVFRLIDLRGQGHAKLTQGHAQLSHKIACYSIMKSGSEAVQIRRLGSSVRARLTVILGQQTRQLRSLGLSEINRI